MWNNAQQVPLEFNTFNVKSVVYKLKEKLLQKVDFFQWNATNHSNLLVAEVYVVEELWDKQNRAQNKSEGFVTIVRVSSLKRQDNTFRKGNSVYELFPKWDSVYIFKANARKLTDEQWRN